MNAESKSGVYGNARMRANLIGLQTLVIKEVTRLLRIWPQTIVPPVITTTLYYVIFIE